MMNILIITNFFHPYNRIASFRMNAFAKYLKEAGYSVTVVTESDHDEIAEWNGCEIHYVKNPVATYTVKDQMRVYCRHMNFRTVLNRFMLRYALDCKYFWRQHAYAEVKRIVRLKHIDIILTSFSEISSHLIALQLKKNKFPFFWIADMRDEMSRNYEIPRFVTERMEPYERKILNAADLVLSVSKPLIDDFRSRCCHNRFLEIRNGYDYDEIHDVSFQRHFTMAYFGRLSQDLKRSNNWFRAFAELIEEKKLPSDALIKIVGNYAELTIPESIQSNVIQIDEVPHSEAIKMFREVDTLVLVHKTGRKGVYTGKVFDYLASNKPILALCDPTDVIATLLDETKAGFIVDEADIAGVKNMILRCYTIWKNEEVLPRDWDKIRQYSRKNQVRNLVKYLLSQKKLN